MEIINQETGELNQILLKTGIGTFNTKSEIERSWAAEKPISAFPKTMSRFANDTATPTREQIISELNKLKLCKTLKSDDAWRLLAGKVIESEMGLCRFLCAIDYLISKYKYQSFQFAHLLEYDEQIPVYRINELNDYSLNSALIGKTFCQIRYNGWRGVWIEKKYADDFAVKTYGELTIGAKEKKNENDRESEFLNTVPVNGLRNSQIFVERFNLRHKTSFASFKELFEWYMALPSDFIRDNRLDEPLFPENKHENFIQ